MSVSLIDGHIDRNEQTITYNKIIKALECCNALVKTSTCRTCPLYTFEGDCTTELLRQTVKFINGQKNKINELIAEIDDLNCNFALWKISALDTLKAKNAEIEKLQQNLKEAHIDIQEKQAEIEALIAGQETLQKYIAEKDAEIEQLKINPRLSPNNKCRNENIDIAQIKSEAVKEFAEKVKLEFYYEFDEIIPSIMADKIDNLVKEMVGDSE